MQRTISIHPIVVVAICVGAFAGGCAEPAPMPAGPSVETPAPIAPTPLPPEPTADDFPPPTARLNVMLDGVHIDNDNPRTPIAIESLSQILFDGSPSAGEGLTYLIDFGDGARSREESVRHQVNANGRFGATLTVTDRFGRTASDRRPFSVANISTYEADPACPSACPFSVWIGDAGCVRMTLFRSRQNGRSVTGDLSVSGSGGSGCPGAWSEHASVAGELTGERDILFTLPSGVTIRGSIALRTTFYYSTIDVEIQGGVGHGQRLTLIYHQWP